MQRKIPQKRNVVALLDNKLLLQFAFTLLDQQATRERLFAQ